MKLSRLTNRQLRRLLARGEVRFSDDDKYLESMQSGLQTYLNKLEQLENVHKRIAFNDANATSTNIRKNVSNELRELFKDAQRFRSYVKKLIDLIDWNVKEMRNKK